MRMDVRMRRFKAVEITLVFWILSALPGSDVARAASREYPACCLLTDVIRESSGACLIRANARAQC